MQCVELFLGVLCMSVVGAKANGTVFAAIATPGTISASVTTIPEFTTPASVVQTQGPIQTPGVGTPGRLTGTPAPETPDHVTTGLPTTPAAVIQTLGPVVATGTPKPLTATPGQGITGIKGLPTTLSANTPQSEVTTQASATPQTTAATPRPPLTTPGSTPKATTKGIVTSGSTRLIPTTVFGGTFTTSVGTTYTKPFISQYCQGWCHNHHLLFGTDPRCASDGNIYISDCDFGEAFCQYKRKGIFLEIVQKGVCPPGYIPTLTQGTPPPTPLANKYPRPPISRYCADWCGLHHVLFGSRACASDGNSYENICEFNKARCEYRRYSKDVKYIRPGYCPASLTPKLYKYCKGYTNCLHVDYCGADGVTYHSQCELRYKNCVDETNVTVEHLGSCVNGTKPSPLQKNCYRICSVGFFARAVCASNGNTYRSLCDIKIHNCLLHYSGGQDNIRGIKYGRCDLPISAIGL